MQKNAREQKPGDFITTKEAAQILNVSTPTLRKYAKSGLIPIYRIGNKILFSKREVVSAVTANSSGKSDSGA